MRNLRVLRTRTSSLSPTIEQADSVWLPVLQGGSVQPCIRRLTSSAHRHRIGYERQGCSRAIDVVLHRGCPAQPDRPDNFSVHLNGKAPTPRRHTRKRGNASQQRRVALDKVEKVLRGDAEQSRIRLILRHLDAKERGPIHPAKRLEIAAVIENSYILGHAKLFGFRQGC